MVKNRINKRILYLIAAAIWGIFAFSSFWGIGEVFHQRERVRKGWFPMRKSCPKAKNPKRKNEY